MEETRLKLVAAVMLFAALVFGQANGKINLPENTLKIDGHANPNAISDTVALRMLYVTAAPKAGVSSAAVPKSLANFFGQILLESDKAKILERIHNWQAVAPANIPAKRNFAQMDAQVNADLDQLKKSLSGQGWAALKDELKLRKQFIKIYEVPVEPGKGKK